MYRRNITLLAVVIFILISLIIILKVTQGKPTQKVVEKKSTPVHVRKVTLKDLSPQYIFYGYIEGVNEIDLIANLDGKIKKVSQKLLNSSKVSKNEILFELDPFEYEQDVIEKKAILNELKIELEKTNFLMVEAKKQLLIAEKDYERKKKLLGNTVSKKSLDDTSLILSKAKTNFSREQYKINSIKTNINKASSQLNVSNKNLKDTKYKAPFSGKIANNTVDRGSEVIRGNLLAKIVNTEILEVKFFVGESIFTELGNLEGKKVKVFWKKSKYRSTYSATITKVDSVIDQQSAGLHMYAGLEKIDIKDPIRPGAFVEILIEGNKVKNSVLLPENAIYEENYVYVLNDKKARKIKIQVKGNVDNKILVTGKFKNNDIIILTRLENLNEADNLYPYNN